MSLEAAAYVSLVLGLALLVAVVALLLEARLQRQRRPSGERA